MLPRVLEPEVMDSPEEARDYDAMDHSTVNRLFVADFLAFLGIRTPHRGELLSSAGTRPAHILDVGTGTAQIPIELCRQAPGVHVVAIDLAEHMLAVGRDNVRRAGFEESIQLHCCDAKRLPFPAASFDAVISNSIVHHIPEPKAVVEDMVRMVRAGGVLFVRDLLRPDDDRAVLRLVQQYAGDANAHQRQMFDASLRAALTLAEVRELVASVGFDRDTVQQTSDRHWTWSAIKTD